MQALIRDMAADVLLKQVNQQTLTQTVTVTNLDMAAADGRCFAILNLGNVWNATSLDVKFQESTLTNSGYGDISGAAFTQQTTTNTTPSVITFDRSKRYLGAVLTVSGTTIGSSLLVGEQLKQL